jgi:phosphopantothenoylcysteine decarboxylase/phosphopantothenate--cysteine ligase
MKKSRASSVLKDKKLLVGITGSVAAYKAVELIRRLRDEGASVSPVMTDASCRFITPLSIELAAGGIKPLCGMFDDPMAHIGLSSEADLMLVAPATANTIGKFARGLADDLLSTSFMAFSGPAVIAPAMNTSMYESPTLRQNLNYLKEVLGVIEVEPGEGMLACGQEGKGKMAEVEAIIEHVRGALAPFADLNGRKVVITAGPTREYMDPVRFISNRSSGRMGYALARAALRQGAEVVLISGPVSISPPREARLVSVQSASEMHRAVMEEIEGAHMLVMSAAVADFAPSDRGNGKLPKEEMRNITLSPTPDILREAAFSSMRPEIVVGFAAETDDSLDRAVGKLKEKGADYIVFNNVLEPGAGFDVKTNRVTVIDRDGTHELPLMSKDEVARRVLSITTKA